MGISCDFEAGSMESEIKPTCNKEFIKLNGLHELDAMPAKTAKTANTITISHNNNLTQSDANTIDDSKSTDDVILISPIPPSETETIVIVDDAEPEEGEIITSDNDFEYEAISSDEEFTLRQQIEALEAKNRELEKIASISARAIDYGYRRSPNYYKSPTTTATINRSANHTKSNPPLSSVTNYKTLSLTHVENISSDEAHLVDSDGEIPSLFDSNKYGRSHRASKKEKRQSRRKTRTIENEKEQRCIVHGKRRCIDAECYPVDVTVTRKKRARHKYDERKVGRGKYSSDSEDELLRNREELKMALNIIEPSNRTVNSSTLSHKLSALQNQQTLDKSSTKHRKRKISRSPERRRRPRSGENSSKRSKNEGDRSNSRSKLVSPIQDNNDNDIQDIEDEAISLEEQELRLIALKSAVLKKHEARKRKQLANQMIEQIVRPYSPTDSVVLVADETGDRSNDCIDSDNNNMDISPISSPGNQYQPMDMDLASSNENSKSPVFSYDKPQTFPYEPFIDWGTVHIPVAINPTYVDMDQATVVAAAAAMNQSFGIQPPYPMMYDTMQKKPMTPENSIPTPIQTDSKENNSVTGHFDNEEELRAQLIEQMRSTNTSSSNSATESMKTEQMPKENSHIDSFDSLEEDCLRSLLLSSKGKKSTAITKESATDLQAPAPVPAPVSKPEKLPEPSVDQTKCDDMPKLALNLREALKRLKNNPKNKLVAATTSTTPTAMAETVMVECKKSSEKCVQLDSKQSDSLHDCDQKEIRKTVVNNRLDKNENELCNSETTVIVPLKGAEEKPTVMLNTVNKVAAVKVNVEDIQKGNEVVAAKPPIKVAPIKVGTTQVAKTTVVAKPKPKVVAKPKVIEKPKLVEKPKVAEKPITIERPQSITPPVTKPTTATTSVTTNLNKMDAIRKTTGSPIITTWTAKPVKKLIIQLNEDSSTDNDDCDESAINRKTDAADSGSQSNDSNNTFQLRLDQFLQKCRANTDAILETKIVATQTTPTAKATPKTVEKSTISATQKSQISSKAESSKAVSHLPMSSQLEYHRLLNRMKLLEKQKEQKSRVKNQAIAAATPLPPAKNESNFPSLTVVIQNENRFIQTNKPSEVENGAKTVEPITKTPAVAKIPTNKILVTTPNTSLAKKVLVKNAMAQATDVPKVPAIKPAVATPALVPGEQPLNSTTDKNDATETKPASMTLAMFEKKPPKVKASLLANYIKRYKNHGEQYLNGLTKLHRLTCRTNLETKKQQKLEQVLDELRRQAKVVEEQLAQQKLLTQSLRPAMAATEKAITTDRMMLLKLENCCNRLGHIVKGPDYKVQCDKDAEIKEKLKLIIIEKNRLKLLGQKGPTLQPAKEPAKIAQSSKNEVASNKVIPSIPKPTPTKVVEQKAEGVKTLIKQQDEKVNTPIINSVDEHSNSAEIQPVENKTESYQEKPVEMEVDVVEPRASEDNTKNPTETPTDKNLVEIRMEEKPKTPEPIKEKVLQNEEILAAETKTQSNNHITKASEIEQAENIDALPPSPDNLTAPEMMEIMDNEGICGKYDSPLDHMQTSTVDSKPNLSAADRNAIVCPYDLMGRCEDKQCQYKHLSM